MVYGIDSLKQAIRDKMSNRQGISLAERRKGTDNIASFGCSGDLSPLNWETIGGVKTAVFNPAEISGTGLTIYAHGGAFVAGSPYSHQVLTRSIARYNGAPVYSVDYKLAPEFPHPAAVEDIVSVFKALVSEKRAPSSISMVGDSAGATLILAAVCQLRNAGHDLPAAIALLSPLYDLTCRSGTYQENAGEDPFISREGLIEDIQQYIPTGNAGILDVQKTLDDLRGLPPLLIQIASGEVLMGDARLLLKKAATDNVRATLEVWPGMTHVWHLFPAFVDEAEEATRSIVHFIKSATGG